METNNAFQNHMYGGAIPLPPLSHMKSNEPVDDDLTDNNPEFVEFKEKIKRWLELDDDIKTLQKAIKDRKTLKNELTPEILEFMDQHDIKDLNTRDGRLQYSKSTTKKALNKKTLTNRLTDFFKDLSKGEKVADFILNNRDTVDRVRLKRTFKRNKKKNIQL